MIERHELLVGGVWERPASGATIEVRSPHDRHPVGAVPLAGPADVDLALSRAAAALAGPWGATTPEERAELIRRLSLALQARAGELAALITDEVGSPYEDVDHAVALANDSDFGLSGSVWTADPGRGVAVAGRIRTGTCAVNSGVIVEPKNPFGGFRSSGIGREMGPEGVEAYLETRTVVMPPSMP